MNRNIFTKIFSKKKYKSLDKDNNLLEENVFSIYTTGLANWGSLEKDQNLIESWKLYCRNSIIENVPEKYKINIYHYDPILKISENYEEQTDSFKKEIKKYINKNLIPFDLKNKRVKYSNFFYQRFTPEIIEEPYIIFDMANLFKFKEDQMNTVMYTNFYNQVSQEILNLNVLRVGFVPNMEISQLILKNRLFKVEDDNTVITYTDMLIWMDKEFDTVEPSLSIRKIVEKIIIIIENKVCELRSEDSKNLPLFKIGNIMERIKDKKLIVAEIMKELWNSTLNEEVYDSIANLIIERNIINILQTELVE